MDEPAPENLSELEQKTPPELLDKSQVALTKVKSQLYGNTPQLANEPRWELGLSSGSHLLNLACSGRIDVAFAPDFYYVWSGVSGSGKSFVTLAALAEASINPAFAEHRLIYDAPETGALMSFQNFYGLEMARRVEPPRGTQDHPEHSKTLEGFYHNVYNALEKGPFVYLLDSIDALPTDDEMRDFLKKHSKRESNDGEMLANEAGSYHTERAKVNAHHLRMVFNQLHNSNSILIVIFQARQNIGFGSQFNPYTKGGGTAPTFYAGLELFSKVKRELSTTYKGNTVQQGVLCEIEVKKGRITGKNRDVEIPIYNSFGIDDIGSMVDFLIKWKKWKRDSTAKDPTVGKITVKDWNTSGSREEIVQYIFQNDLEDDLKDLVTETWNEIERAAVISRKSRYHKS